MAKKRKSTKKEAVTGETIATRIDEAVVQPVSDFTQEWSWNSGWSWMLAGVALGVGAAILFDPAQGRHRRSLIRDKGVSLVNRGWKSTARKGRDLRNRTGGMMHRAGAGTSTDVETGTRV
jgi:hypothetical protein